jgi:RNA-directed DNA polymerase
MIIVRYADDYIVGFEREHDARRFLADLRDRLATFSLELAAEKTRLIEFGRFAARDRARRGLGKPETFDFLGFTHCCARTKNGRFMLKRITIAKRMRRKLHEIKDELVRRRHHSIPEQGRWLGSVLRGHYAYYAVPGNSDRINRFYNEVTRHWLRALRRRSQRHRMPWTRMRRISARWLRPPNACTPSPTRDSPPPPKAGAQCANAHAGICAGGRPKGRSLPRSRRGRSIRATGNGRPTISAPRRVW